jgi:endonuclease/exonuclease/phosphatase family metal-dependent hydrolase
MSSHRGARRATRPETGSARKVSLPSWRVLATALGLVLVLGLAVVPGRVLWAGEDSDLRDASASLTTEDAAGQGPEETASQSSRTPGQGPSADAAPIADPSPQAGPDGKQGTRSDAVSRAAMRTPVRDSRPWAFADLHKRTKVVVAKERKLQAKRIAVRKAAERKKKEQKRRKEMARRARMAKTSSFRVGSLNILGSQHTRGAGGYGPGPERAGISAGLVTSRGVDVMTMQEVQDDQLPVLLNRLPGYSIWPQHELGSNGQRLQIAWRDSRFERVDTGSVSYVFDSQTIPLPYVLLRDRETQAEFWVITTHNSARDLEGQRDAATARQIALIKELQARNGKPVLITGDVNEHEEFFYSVCGATGFLAANGGGAGCSLPPRPLRVDWIMGGGGGGVDFSGYVQDGASLARASDHYFIHAAVNVTDPGEQ